MAGCKEIIKSLGFHIDIFVLKPVYCKEFALHRGWMQTKITSSFSGLNLIPDLGLFPPKYLIGIWAWMDLCLLVTPVVPAVSGTSGAALCQILLNSIISGHGGNLSSSPLGFSSFEDPVSAAHGASPAGDWWMFRHQIKLVFDFWSL